MTCRPAKELVLSKEKPIPYQPPLPPNEAPSGVDAAAGVTPVGLRPPFVTPAAAHSHPDCRGIPILIVALDRCDRGAEETKLARRSELGHQMSIGIGMGPLSVSKRGSDAILMKLACADQSRFEQIDLCPALHHALDELELVDLTFCLTVRPWLDNGGTDGLVRGNAGVSVLTSGNQALGSHH